LKYGILDLFSGIGGFSLGLEAARAPDGTRPFETLAFCENCPEARKVLRKHWPDTRIYKDIKELTYEKLQADGVRSWIWTLGFPCQDISLAGGGEGIHGERSGLWAEAFRLLRDVPEKPAYCIVENVSALRSRGLALVLQDLESLSYLVEVHAIPAQAVNAPHRRDRIWIIGRLMADPRCESEGGSSYGPSHQRVNSEEEGERPTEGDRSRDCSGGEPRLLEGYLRRLLTEVEPWPTEVGTGVCRVSHGVPRRVHRLRQLGNAVVPRIPQLIGEAILEWERDERL